jgi:hypothetical protein
VQRAQADGRRPRHVLLSIVHEQAGGAIRLHDIEGDLVDPSNPAREIKRDDLGHLTVGAIADLGIFSLASGDFGFVDSFGGLLKGNRKLVCEMTVKDGQTVFDLNGRTREDWRSIEPLNYPNQGDSRWDGILHRRRRRR